MREPCVPQTTQGKDLLSQGSGITLEKGLAWASHGYFRTVKTAYQVGPIFPDEEVENLPFLFYGNN